MPYNRESMQMAVKGQFVSVVGKPPPGALGASNIHIVWPMPSRS